MVTANAGMTGEFIWTAFDYLGEVLTLPYPTIGATLGVMDRMGTPKPIAANWQRGWGMTPPAAPPAAGAATRVAVSADHTSLLTDPNDVVYIKAAIADTNGR